MAPKLGLGRGLDALIPANDVAPAAQAAAAIPGLTELPVNDIRPNPHQPRMTRGLDRETLEALAGSIKAHGVIQPLIVVRSSGGNTPWTLIAGERRWRASQLAGLQKVPVVIKDYAPQQMLEVALIENVQRSDLSAIEEAVAYQHLIEDFALTQGEVAARVGKSREDISNTVRLLKLPNAVQQAVIQGEISEGHARPLLSPHLNLEQQMGLFELIKKERWSVRQTEEYVKRLVAGLPTQKRSAKKAAWDGARDLENRLRNALGTKVSLQRGRKGGKIVIEFYSDEEFDAIFSKIVAEG